MHLTPDEVTFCILTFEGPDHYSRAGGLGVRVTHLAETLASQGYETRLLFIGDPAKPGFESRFEGKLIFHRWCQWISAHHPGGVYDGEEGKLSDFAASVPPFLLEQFVKPSLNRGKLPVILAEEWHTSEALIQIYSLLCSQGLGDRVLLVWNANNTMSFHRVDWFQLQQAAQLTTVSRYMKHLMWRHGVDPLVIYNGIPSQLLEPVPVGLKKRLRKSLDPEGEAVILFKAGRFDPAKRWLMAIEAAAKIKDQGLPVVFLMSGGIESHRAEVLAKAYHLGLCVREVFGAPDSPKELIRLLADTPRADIFDLHFFMGYQSLQLIYGAVDAVLANSGHEPFGLVGLEAMAAGGVVFTGATGEEYVGAGENAIVLDTDRSEEIVFKILQLRARPEKAIALRKAARAQAAGFTWEKITGLLLEKLQLAARLRGTSAEVRFAPAVERVKDVLIYLVVHQPKRLRLPASPIPKGSSLKELEELLFDTRLNEKYFRKVADQSYYPMLEVLPGLLDSGLRMAIGFSISFVEQARALDATLLQSFCSLVKRKEVELIAVEPRHSFLPLMDITRFQEEMRLVLDQLQAVFGVRPACADTTELMMSDTIYHALQQIGCKGSFLDGRPWVMQWRQPTHLYHHGGGAMKLLPRHFQLSDDVGYRFSDRNWSGWPLTADHYAEWLAGNPGDLVVLGWDFETFGEHHRRESGILDFLEAFPDHVRKSGLSFTTPTEAIERYQQESFELPLPAFPSTWAGSGGLEFFLGNDAQRAIFRLMNEAYQKARLTGDAALVETALWLAQSDNLHLIQWQGRTGSEAEVSAYFTPQEWWALTPDGIVWEMQQVYKNFIDWLDESIPRKVPFNE